MPTNIVTIGNQTTLSAVAFNSENIGNSFWIQSTSTTQTQPGLWISWHQDRPLVFMTPKGVCHVWDKDWEIRGIWEGTVDEILFLSGGEQGVGGNIDVSINQQGDLTMRKHQG